MYHSIAITISPPNRVKWTGFCNPNRNLYDSDKFIIEAVLKYNRIKDYLIYPEFDVKGRLHYHGILNLTNAQRIRLYKHAQPKLTSIGYVDVKPIDSKLTWLCYIKKQWHFTAQVLELITPICRVKLPEFHKIA